MISTWFSLRHETAFKDSNPPLKDKADHDQLEACVRCPQGDEHFAHTLPECTQGESHPRRTINTQDDLREALTWYSGLPPRSIDNFDTLVERFSVQYATSRSHWMTLTTLTILQQANDESFQKFTDRFRCITIQIHNLITLHAPRSTASQG
ncbi:hypothetical protein GmHk_03G007030 [Glycine max]|nr:hypothetical protein GmHk_03G007030 [Glycine max]